jgi:hypothetical protein
LRVVVAHASLGATAGRLSFWWIETARAKDRAIVRNLIGDVGGCSWEALVCKIVDETLAAALPGGRIGVISRDYFG